MGHTHQADAAAPPSARPPLSTARACRSLAAPPHAPTSIRWPLGPRALAAIGALASAGLLMGAAPAPAEPPPPGAPAAPAPGASTLPRAPLPASLGGEPESEGCSADERRERLAQQAAVRDRAKLALMATVWTIGHAEQVAHAWWEERAADFLRAARQRGDRYLNSIGRSGERRREIGPALCQALAAREDAQCATLPDLMDRAACGSWLALEAALRPAGTGCDALPSTLAGACRHLATPGHTCASEPEAARDACDQLADAVSGADAACRVLEDPTICGWALLASGLGAEPGTKVARGRSVCDRVAPGPGRSTTLHVRTHSVCRAVLGADPRRCPPPGAPLPPAPDQVHHFVDAEVLGAVSGAQVVVGLQVDTPAICALTVEILAGEDVADELVEVVVANSWQPQAVVRELARGSDPRGLRAVTAAACAPRLVWKPEATVPLAPPAPRGVPAP